MGFNKFKLIMLLIFFHFLLLLPLHSTADLIREPNAMDSEIGNDKEMTMKSAASKRVVSVDRKGGGGGRGGGGRGFGGRRGGVGGGEAGGNGRPKLIPVYLPHRQNNQQHHNGSNQGKLNTGLLLLLLLVVYLFRYFA